MNYQLVEDAIIAKLKSKFDLLSISVENLPDNEADFKQAFQKPKIYVVYNNTTYNESGSMGAGLSQTNVITFEVIIQAKKMRGAGNGQDCLNGVRLLLVGFQPEITQADNSVMTLNPLYLSKEETAGTGFDSGVWTIRQYYSMKDLVVQESDEGIDEFFNTIINNLNGTLSI